MDELMIDTKKAILDSKYSDNEYLDAATSINTKKAYQSDIEHYKSAGFHLPATPEEIVSYLKQFAGELNPRTLSRRITSIKIWHELKGLRDPVRNPLVRKMMKGISRLHGVPKKQAQALRIADLEKISAHLLSKGDLISVRNRAVILLGFFGALRRSEIVNLKWEHVSFEKEGIELILLETKTDQVREGQKCIIPFGNDSRCPVRALLAWRKESKLWEGYIFRPFNKKGELIERNRAMSARHINILVQNIVRDSGMLDSELYSAHSLRRGFATESARLGASMASIQKHGRWKSTKTVLEYIEAGRKFEDSALNVLYDFS